VGPGDQTYLSQEITLPVITEIPINKKKQKMQQGVFHNADCDGGSLV